MQAKNLDELLQLTCSRVDYIDNFKKTPNEDILVVMYKAVKKDFESSLKLLMLTSNYDIERKKIKYLLRKSKKLRKQSWKLSFRHIAEEYKTNKIDMCNIEYNKLEEKTLEFKLFNEDKKPINFKPKKEKKTSSLIRKFFIKRKKKDKRV